MFGRVVSNASTSAPHPAAPVLAAHRTCAPGPRRALSRLIVTGTDGEGEGGVAAGVMAFGECARLGVDSEQRETREKFFKNDAGLQPGCGSADAVVCADGEGQVTQPAR